MRVDSCARFLVAAMLIAVAPLAPAQSDADFVAARTAFEHGDLRRLDALAPALAGHPLERYIQYWQLKSRLDQASADGVEAFIARYADSPLAERLRVEWLKQLGRRGDFERFAASYRPQISEDPELACYAIQLRVRRDGASALADARPLWFNGQSTPDACNVLFTALVARGEITLADRKSRFRLAVAGGNTRLAQAIAEDLPGNERITPREFGAIERDPLHAVRKGVFDWKSPSGRELALYALERAARKDAAGARDAWLKWRGRVPEADRNYGNLRVAMHAARQLDPAANQWFKEVAGVALAPEQQAWRVRAALRSAAWPDVKTAIEALPASNQQEPAWRYWRARALASQLSLIHI